jgi:uncharacterized protein
MTLLAKLTDEMKQAMREREARLLSALRMLISAIRYAQIDSPEVDELAVLAKEAKKRRESVVAYRAAGREEAALAEEFEVALIERYLPKQLDPAEVEQRVKEILENNRYENFGMAMQAVMKSLGNLADGGLVAKLVRENYKA